MKRILSTFLAILIAASMFSISFTSYADEFTITFHSNNSLAVSQSFTKSLSETANLYEIPDVGDRYIFKGWYYGKEESAEPVDFANDTFSANTDVYAHWASIGVTPADESDIGTVGSYDDFSLAGVQVKSGDFNDTQRGGLRFIASVNNNLIKELDALSDKTTGQYSDKVEYGFVAAKSSSAESWKEFGAGRGYNLDDYKIGYNSENVNGINTTLHDENYQGIVSNIDCTASDYSLSDINDYNKFDKYRLYTLAITYSKQKGESGEEYTDTELEELRNAGVAVRAYLRYYDANGLLRTVYSGYDGTNTYGGLCTSYSAVENLSVDIGYYSSVYGMLTDVNASDELLGDCSQDEAACMAYKSGDTIYMKLLKDTGLSGSVTLNKKADINLNGCTLSTGSCRINSTAEFSMSNGTYVVSSSAQALCAFENDLTKLSNIDFVADGLRMESQFNGIITSSKSIYISDCKFDITAQSSDKSCYSNVFYGTKTAVVRGCEYNISSGSTFTSVIYSLNSELSIDDTNVEIEQTAQNTNATAYGVQAWSSDKTSINNSTISISGDYDNPCAVLAKNADEEDLTRRFFEANNLTINMDIDNLYATKSGDSPKSLVRGLCLAQGEQAVIGKVDVDIDTIAPAYAGVYGLLGDSDAQILIKDYSADISVSETATVGEYTSANAYSVNGLVMSGTSTADILAADIRVPIGYNGSSDTNSGILATGNSIVTITPENDSDVYIQGGYAALSNNSTSKFIITGGNFCSQSHGGAYLAGDADITGGNYYVINEGPYVPSEGGFYVTNNAVVNISNATITGGKNGICTKSNAGRTDNPDVTIANTAIVGGAWGVRSSAGMITLNEGVTIRADNLKYEAGGTITDNR